jgi:hypothetical protein
MNSIGRLSLILAFVVVGIGMGVRAQTLEEYKAAAEAADHGEGCTSIPSADLRDRCKRASDFVEQECKQKPFGCKDLLENQALASSIKGKEDSIESLKKQKDDLERKKSDASDSDKRDIEDKINDLEKQIDNESRSLEDMKKALATDRSDAGIRADQGRRCLEARNDVQYLFTSARSSAQSESDAGKKPLADKLVDYWERRRADHEDAVNKTKEAIEYCEKCKSGER